MRLDYLLLRSIRHYMPPALFTYVLRNTSLLTPGPETRTPVVARDQYQETLGKTGQSFSGKRVLVFGYGGNFALGCMLLEAGATHVLLCDKYACPNQRANHALLATYGEYLVNDGEYVLPNENFITLLHTDIRQVASDRRVPQVDLVLSRSVYEHLDDVGGITRSLAALTSPAGTHVHYINLSDHFFKYPFEMLTFSRQTWERWLNPTSNLNRYRYPEYRSIFENYFENVHTKIWEHNREAFEKARPRIRAEFISGDPEIDCATKMIVVASNPRKI